MAGPLLIGKAIKAGADALDYKLPYGLDKVLDPVGSAKRYAIKKAEEAMDLPPETIGFAMDPVGFAKNIAKDTGKDFVKNQFFESGPVEVEDRIPSPVGNLPNFDENDIANMEWEGDYKRGGRVKAKASPKSSSKPKMSTASRRGDGIAQRGKTRGRMV